MSLKFPCTINEVVEEYKGMEKRRDEVISALNTLVPRCSDTNWRTRIEKDGRFSTKILYAELLRLEDEITQLLDTLVGVAPWDKLPVDKSLTFDK